MQQYDREASGQAAGSSGQLDHSLDFFSPQFDAQRALLTEGLQPPIPAARPQDNVFMCRFMLPPDHPEAWQGSQRAEKSKVGGFYMCSAHLTVHLGSPCTPSARRHRPLPGSAPQHACRFRQQALLRVA